MLAGTWANRDYMYAATSDGVTDTGERVISVPTIFEALETAKVPYGVRLRMSEHRGRDLAAVG